MATIIELLNELREKSARAGVRGPGATGAMTARGYVPSQPSKVIPQQLRDALMNKAARGERLSDSERAILEEAGRQQQAGLLPPYEPGASRLEPEPAAAPTPEAVSAATGVPEEAVTIMGADGKFFLVDAGGERLEEVTRLRDGTFSLPNGTRLQMSDDAQGFEVVPGDLTTTSAAGTDNLEASAVELDGPKAGARGVGRKRKGPSKIDKLADDIRQATAPAAGEEALANLPAIVKRVEALATEGRLDELLTHPSIAEGIESLAARNDPAAREAAIGRARARLEALRGSVSTTDRAAAQLDSAAQARQSAGRPAAPNADRRPAEADFTAARQLVGETLPKGDFRAVAAAYNALPPEARAALLSRMDDSTREALRRGIERVVQDSAGGPLDRAALRQAADPQFAQLMQGGDMSPAVVDAITRPVNDIEGLLQQLDAAMRSGNEEAVAALRQQVQEAARASAEEGVDPRFTGAAVAQRNFLGRRQLADSLRRELIGQDPMVAAEASRMRAAAVAPPQPSNIAPGARQPEVQAFDRQPNEMPTDADEARSLGREAAMERADRAPLGGMEDGARREAFGDDLPVFLRGEDRNPPMETRRRNERLDTRDIDAVEKAERLEQEVAQAQQAVDAAADPAARVAALSRLQKAYAAIDKAYPPRLVNDATGEVIARVTPAQRRGEEIPKGYRLETGRKAYADSSVNRASAQETFEDLFFGVTGFRRRGRRAISNTNEKGMSAQDLGASLDDARLEFGDDVSEFIDDLQGDFAFRDEVNELIDAPPVGRKQQVRGGQPQQSRLTDSLDRGFGGINPLDSGMTAEEVAREVASRVRGLRPGTATYDLMVERFAKAVQDKYGQPAGFRTGVDASEAKAAQPVSSRPQDPAPPAADDLPPVAGDVPAAAADDLPPAAGDVPAATPEAAKLDASATELGEVAGDLPPPAAARDTATVRIGDQEYVVPRAAVDDIQTQADAVREEAYQAAIAAGVPKRKAAIQAGEARKAYVEQELRKAHEARAAGLPPSKGDLGAADATPAPAAADATPAAAAPDDLPPPAGDVPPRADADPATPDADRPPKADDDLPAPEGDLEADKPKADGDTPPKDKDDRKDGDTDGSKDGDTGGKPAPESLLKRLRSGAWKWGRRGAIAGGLVGAGLIGRGVLEGLTQGSGVPPGPAPGPGGGGMPPVGLPPLPPVGQGGAGDPAADREARINAAVEGIMRGENLRGRLPQYQIPQAYNQWN
jgi:hypothetical protein